ncbi:DUF7508 domain-containing protein [Haloplanus sp.]|uniref:DUF7508 domain-containing protein n=1 Tax=Haloplanus sp. TaxID=1961696 RepID=UPI002636BF4C|nr:hypothetical protein [Haloplanus sp.]
MPLQTRFYEFERSRPPDVIGVYELGWRDGSVVYIGAGVIRARLCAHRRDPDKRFSVYRCQITNDRRRAGQMERREQRKFQRRHSRLPRFNNRVG